MQTPTADMTPTASPIVTIALLPAPSTPAAADVEYLEAGDRVWVEFPAEWDSWDGKPTYCPGELVFTQPVTQRGLVVYRNAHGLISQGWFSVERVYGRTQRLSFDRPELTAALQAEAVRAAV